MKTEAGIMMQFAPKPLSQEVKKPKLRPSLALESAL